MESACRNSKAVKTPFVSTCSVRSKHFTGSLSSIASMTPFTAIKSCKKRTMMPIHLSGNQLNRVLATYRATNKDSNHSDERD
uniref:Uncharacterized protein n=1 Tax=Parascaris univalens TaxID=6257 RepID=A0A914ZZJ8_PARUN